MNKQKELILVTDWEKPERDDFYLTGKWIKGAMPKEVIEALESNTLYIAYLVPATDYAIYNQMDAQQVFINDNMDIVLECETAIISNNHQKRFEYEY